MSPPFAPPSRHSGGLFLLCLAAGCGPDPGAPAPATGPAATAAGPVEPAGPDRWELHGDWAKPLAGAGAAFETLRSAAAEPDDPLALPALTDDTFTADHYAAAKFAFYRARAAEYSAAAGLGGAGGGLLALVAEVGRADGPGWDELRAAADAAAGSDDPVVRGHVAWAEDARAVSTAESADALLAAAAALGEEAPPFYRHRVAFWAFRAARGLPADAAGRADRIDRAAALAADGLTALLAAAPDWEEGGEPQTGRLIYDYASDLPALLDRDDENDRGLHADFLAAASAGCRAEPTGAGAYAFHCLMGDRFLTAGWAARGTASAGSTSGKQFGGLERNMTAAADHLHAAYLLRPNLAPAPTGLITVARGGADTLGARRWFAEAVAAQVDYAAAFGNVRVSLQPRWGGSLRELLALADECLRDDLRDTDLPVQALYALRDVRRDRTDGFGEVPEELRRDVLTRTSERFAAGKIPAVLPGGRSRGDAAWLVSGLALECLDADLPDAAVAALEAWPGTADDAPTLRPWLDGFRREYLLGPLLAARGEAAAEAAELAAVFSPAAVEPDAFGRLAAVPAADLPGLRAAEAAVRAAAGEDAAQLGWLEDADLSLTLLEKLYAGETAGPPVSDGLPGWRCAASWHEVTYPEGRPTGIVDLSGDGREDTAYLSPLVALPEPFFVTATLKEVPESEPWSAPAGVSFGPGAWDPFSRGGSLAGGFYFFDTVFSRPRRFIGFEPLPIAPGNRSYVGPRYVPPAAEWALLGMMLRPGTVVTFAGGHYTDAGTGPDALQPVRIGRRAGFTTPFRVQVCHVRFAHCPEFTAPQYLLDVPDPYRRATPEAEDDPTGEPTAAR